MRTKFPCPTRKTNCWAVLKRSVNQLDGARVFFDGTTGHASRTLLFETRREALDYVETKYGYQRSRPGLRAEPHGWRMPKVVRVRVTVAEARP